jgi:hypothetical protein
VGTETRLAVSADWRSVPPGEHRVPIVIRGGGGTVTVIAHIVSPASAHEASGYVEANGYVAIEAAHYSRAVPDTGTWVEIPGLGRTLSGVTSFSMIEASATPGGNSPSLAATPHLQYEIYLFSSGEARVDVTLAPTLRYTGGEGMRYAVSVDEEPPRIVNIHTGDSEELWSAWVSNNANVQSTRHAVTHPGRHTVRLWAIDPGLVFQRVVVAMRDLPASYLGPPESMKI